MFSLIPLHLVDYVRLQAINRLLCTYNRTITPVCINTAKNKVFWKLGIYI